MAQTTPAATQTAAIWQRARTVQDRVVAIRRDFHAHPELSYGEKRTAAIVEGVLRELGLEVRTGIAGTGVAGVLKGALPGKTLGLRADMDALPLEDLKKVPYASQVPGVGHLCGHDAHTAMQLGVAMVLAGMRDQLAGSIKFIFEPAEETVDNKCYEGTKAVVEDGVLENPKVDAVIGCHVSANDPTGQVVIRPGAMMTGLDMMDIAITGKFAHTSQANQGVDAIVAASQVVSALQTLASREASPTECLIVNVGTIQGGRARNTLADRVELSGSVRTSDMSLRPSLRERVERVIRGVTEGLRAGYEFKWVDFLPFVVNDPQLTSAVQASTRAMLGEDKITVPNMPKLAGETFHYYGNFVPSAFWFLGTGNPEKNTKVPSHSSYFDIDEDALAMGMGVISHYCLSWQQ